MSEVETFHDSQDRESDGEEVVFREDTPRVESSTPPSMVTANDLDVVIEGLGEEVSIPLPEHPRDPIGLRKGQYQHGQYREGRPRARGSPGAPHRGNARGDSHNSSKDVTLRISQRRAVSIRQSPARHSRLQEHRPDFVQTLISTLPSISPRQRSQRTTTYIRAT